MRIEGYIVGMKPNKQKKMTFTNKCGCRCDYGLLEDAMLWYANGNLRSDRVIYMYGRYPAVSIYNEKLHIHRLVYMYMMQRLLVSNVVVHHKDGDRLNCHLDNLEHMSAKLHGSHHNKGKTISEAHKKAISIANKKRKGMKMKKRVNIPPKDLELYLDMGYSINKIASLFECSWDTVRRRIDDIHENPELLEDK